MMQSTGKFLHYPCENKSSLSNPDNSSLNNIIEKKHKRNSNLELYRIIVMILIVAHHYVANSGLYEILKENVGSISSSLMLLFGAWGKTGINCFVLITGYFMCRSKFSWEKLIKLYSQIVFYAIIIYSIFYFIGYETFSIKNIFFKFFPIRSITTGFTSCFLLFYLFIPFINIFLTHLSKRMHFFLVALLLGIYTILPSLSGMRISFNYVEWFITIYILSSYIRFYGEDWKISNNQWGLIALICFAISCFSILGMEFLFSKGYIKNYNPYFFVDDCNKIMALSLSISSFMWFKNLKIKYSPIINLIGASTFGVLLIHANSETMRIWLWREMVDCSGHFGPIMDTVLYAVGSVLIIFIICSFIEILRIKYVEPIYIKWLVSINKTKLKQELTC